MRLEGNGISYADFSWYGGDVMLEVWGRSDVENVDGDTISAGFCDGTSRMTLFYADHPINLKWCYCENGSFYESSIAYAKDTWYLIKHSVDWSASKWSGWIDDNSVCSNVAF